MPALLSELTFLQPFALWSLAALAIPILIHLFNRSRGRLVKIGHIDLLRDTRKLQVTELKLSAWLLLLLRICLFTLAALLLAGLALPGLSSNAKATAYVTPAWLLNAQAQEITELLDRYADERTSRVQLLQDGFPVLDRQLAEQLREEANPPFNISSVWPLLADRLSFEHHRESIEVYAVDNLAQFADMRPSLPGKITWKLSQLETKQIA